MLLMGSKTLSPENALRRLRHDDECDLTLCGILCFLDPVKQGAESALASLKSRGFRSKFLPAIMPK